MRNFDVPGNSCPDMHTEEKSRCKAEGFRAPTIEGDMGNEARQRRMKR